MQIIAWRLFVGILALIFGALAYFGTSQDVAPHKPFQFLVHQKWVRSIQGRGDIGQIIVENEN